MNGDIAPNSLEAYWLPFTANKEFKAQPRLLLGAKGMYYRNHHGARIIDGSAGLFCVAAGHGRREIADAVHQALLTNDYVPAFGFAHPAAFALAQRVAALLPEPLNHVFFTNSGSESVDTALKIAMLYHLARGEGQRLRFVSRERAYHGVNIGGVSLSGMMRNRQAFPGTMPHVVHMRHTWREDNRFTKGQGLQGGVELADDLQRIVDTYGADAIAACFVEPVAGSTGCLVPPVGYLQRLREICDRHGILLVFDEVICGFGRLGAPFASQIFGVIPDMTTMAKALTNGCQPMGAVAVSDDIYDTIVNGSAQGIEFFHGYTYSAHPAACAAALASQDIYESEGLFDRAAELSGYFLEQLWRIKDSPLVTDLRGIGLLAGFDLAPDGVAGARGARVQKSLFSRGCYLKFTADSAIIAPPLICEKSHIDEIIAILQEVLEQEAGI